MQWACAILSSVTCPAIQYFSTLSYKLCDFLKEKKKRHWTQNLCFDFLYKFRPTHFSFEEELNDMWSKICLHVQYPLFLSDLMKFEFSRQILKKKHSNINFHEIPASGRCVVPCGQTGRHTDGRTDLTKLIIAFRNFVNAPKTAISSCDIQHNNKLTLTSS